MSNGLAGKFDSGEIEVAVVRELVELADLGAEDADEMLGLGASELGGATANLRDEEASASHRIGSFYGTNPALPKELAFARRTQSGGSDLD